MSLTQIIEAVKKSQETQREILSRLLPISEAQTIYFDDYEQTIQLTEFAEALENTDDAGLSDKAVDMRDELVALLKAFNDEVAECVKENQESNRPIFAEKEVEVNNMENILATAAEKVLTQKILINSTKFTDEQMKAFREIYLELGVTHFLIEDLRDVIYYNPEAQPYLRDLIAERFMGRFPTYVNPKGYMNMTSVDFMNNLDRIQKAAVK
jgi:hypothetical protein